MSAPGTLSGQSARVSSEPLGAGLASDSFLPPLLHQAPPPPRVATASILPAGLAVISATSNSPVTTAVNEAPNVSRSNTSSLATTRTESSQVVSTLASMPSLSAEARPLLPVATIAPSSSLTADTTSSSTSSSTTELLLRKENSVSNEKPMELKLSSADGRATMVVVERRTESEATTVDPPVSERPAVPPIMAAKHHQRPKVHSFLSTPLTSLIANSKKPAVIDPTKLMKLPAPPCSQEKLEFMESLGLITIDTWKEIKSRRMVRKRRNAAPFSVDLAEKEARRLRELKELQQAQRAEKRGRGRPAARQTQTQGASSSAPTSLLATSRGNQVARNGVRPSATPMKFTVESSSQTDEEPPPKKRRRLLVVAGATHDDRCASCGEGGELLMCDTCTHVYHLHCLSPPLSMAPNGLWICPLCKDESKSLEPREWPGTLSLIQSYVLHHDAQERERAELAEHLKKRKAERIELQTTMRDLSDAIQAHIEQRGALDEENAELQASLDHLNNFIRLFKS